MTLSTHSYFEDGSIKTVNLDLKSPEMQLGESELWKYEETKGTFGKHISKKVCLTNFRAFIYDYNTNMMQNSLLISLVDDIVIRNKQRVSSSRRMGFFTGAASGFLVAAGVGFTKSRSKNLGDVHFMRNGMDYLIIQNIPDPDGFVSYVKAIMKQVYPKKILADIRKEIKNPQLKKDVATILFITELCLNNNIGNHDKLVNFKNILLNSRFDTFIDIKKYEEEFNYVTSFEPQYSKIDLNGLCKDYMEKLEQDILRESGFLKENFQISFEQNKDGDLVSHVTIKEIDDSKFGLVRDIVNKSSPPYSEFKEQILSLLEAEFKKLKTSKVECGKCGKKIPKDSSFCNNCGNKIE